MAQYWIGMATALWLGVLTSISPCPLATNIVALSFIGRKFEKVRFVLFSGLLYSLGRMVAYTTIGLLIMSGLLAIPSISFFLQKYINIILGPVLIMVAMFLLELVSFSFAQGQLTATMQNRFKNSGVWASLPLGLAWPWPFAQFLRPCFLED